MSEILFLVSSIALLATPGPTNTLLAASGARRGFAGSLTLLPMEIFGYAISILVLVIVGKAFLDGFPYATAVLKLLSAAWLMLSAALLWRSETAPDSTKKNPVSAGKVFVTTLLNPKGFVFAFVIFPTGPIETTLYWLALLSGLILLAGASWVALGVALSYWASKKTAFVMQYIYRTASVTLALFAVTIIMSLM